MKVIKGYVRKDWLDFIGFVPIRLKIWSRYQNHNKTLRMPTIFSEAPNEVDGRSRNKKVLVEITIKEIEA